MDFLGELRKFLGGVAGDQRTNAGLAVHKAEADQNKINSAGGQVLSVPFEYNKNGKRKAGVMYMPSYSVHQDLSGDDNTANNNRTISIYGAELDDGSQMDYDQTVNFLNNLNSKNKFKLLRNSVVSNGKVAHPNAERNSGSENYTTAGKNFNNNLRDLLSLSRNNILSADNPSLNRYSSKDWSKDSGLFGL